MKPFLLSLGGTVVAFIIVGVLGWFATQVLSLRSDVSELVSQQKIMQMKQDFMHGDLDPYRDSWQNKNQ